MNPVFQEILTLVLQKHQLTAPEMKSTVSIIWHRGMEDPQSVWLVVLQRACRCPEGKLLFEDLLLLSETADHHGDTIHMPWPGWLR